jgi:hypothetical protein
MFMEDSIVFLTVLCGCIRALFLLLAQMFTFIAILFMFILGVPFRLLEAHFDASVSSARVVVLQDVSMVLVEVQEILEKVEARRGQQSESLCLWSRRIKELSL